MSIFLDAMKQGYPQYIIQFSDGKAAPSQLSNMKEVTKKREKRE
jgi:hypothetical protein